jgi:hypothetical protein
MTSDSDDLEEALRQNLLRLGTQLCASLQRNLETFKVEVGSTSIILHSSKKRSRE